MATETTYSLDIPEVGVFECLRRTQRTSIKFMAEFNRLTEGQVNVSPYFQAICEVHAYLRTMIVSSPDDWDLDGADPDSEEAQKRIMAVYDAIRAEEERFRGRSKGNAKAAGEGTKPVD